MKRILTFILLAIVATSTAQEKRVVVVGAGLAGLTAAYRLQQQGYPVEVYEARGRPGGRVNTAYFGDSYEELGGKNLLDGSDGLAIKGLMKDFGLSSEEKQFSVGDGIFYFQNKGYLIKELTSTGPEPTEALYQKLKTHAASAKNLSELVLPIFHDNFPLQSFIIFCLTNYIGSAPERLAVDLPLFWYIYTFFYHAPGQEAKMTTFESVKGGNSQLIWLLARSLPIHYNSPLTSIDYREGKIHLVFGCEKKVEADCLVLALPASTLRDVTIEGEWFPCDQLEAMHTQQYGTNAKILQPISNLDRSLFSCTDRVGTWTNIPRDVMTWYYGGEAGIFRPTSLSKVCCHDLPTIQKIYPEIQFSENPPTYMQEGFMVSYEGPVGVSWVEEPYSKGSYSNVSPTQFEIYNQLVEIDGEKVRQAYRPFKELIYFVGEHTDIPYPGTMEGAVRSGEMAARLISLSH